MIIFTVIVTHNRTLLLDRAMQSVFDQKRKPDEVFVVSNSDNKHYLVEQRLCKKYGFIWLANSRTPNYAGALNTGIQHYLENYQIEENVYFSSLDDDDIWATTYLESIEFNAENKDIVFAKIIRDNANKTQKVELPKVLEYNSFLATNPGVGGSNTFVRLSVLLEAGAFDERMYATVDRDLFVRLFLLYPTYKIIDEYLVKLYVEEGRERVTTNNLLKLESYRYFYYKYQYLMEAIDRAHFFSRAKAVFDINESEITLNYTKKVKIRQQAITFDGTIDFQFIIGFIAGDKTIALRIIQAIISKKINISKLVIINNLTSSENFIDTKELLEYHKINFTIVDRNEWKVSLQKGGYGQYFKKYTQINSIPIGRTILQHHLYVESIPFKKPVFWVIDDDVSFTNTIYNDLHTESIDLFNLINQNIDQCDALIGSVSKDPPLPFLSSIRSQLIDLYYSSLTTGKETADYGKLYLEDDYYYDITDFCSNHVETPIYYNSDVETDVRSIFSGKSVSRPCLQKKIIGKEKLVTNRGPNTLIFNRDLMRFYPVVNMEVNEKFVRRGDLLWALLNQLISNRKIIEHSFCIDQNRPFVVFDIKRELDKSANDIIGYAFNKAIIETIQIIKDETKPNESKAIYKALNQENYRHKFILTYSYFLAKRKARFLMNYYRIIGLIRLLANKKGVPLKYLEEVTIENLEAYFLKTLVISEKEGAIKQFLETLSSAIWSYAASITNKIEAEGIHVARIIDAFDVQLELRLLGKGLEGIVFTDEKFIYKSFFAIKNDEWSFLRGIGSVFYKSSLLENLDFLEKNEEYYIRYPYYEHKKVDKVPKSQLVEFLIFCRANEFVFSNIKPSNFILTKQNKLKLIDYGRSFEPYTEDKFVNMLKRAYLMLKKPQVSENQFEKWTNEINKGKVPDEILDWKSFLKEVKG